MLFCPVPIPILNGVLGCRGLMFHISAPKARRDENGRYRISPPIPAYRSSKYPALAMACREGVKLWVYPMYALSRVIRLCANDLVKLSCFVLFRYARLLRLLPIFRRIAALVVKPLNIDGLFTSNIAELRYNTPLSSSDRLIWFSSVMVKVGWLFIPIVDKNTPNGLFLPSVVTNSVFFQISSGLDNVLSIYLSTSDRIILTVLPVRLAW